MPSFELNIYRRTTKGEMRGTLDQKKILIEADDASAAAAEATEELTKISWETHFAALHGEDGTIAVWGA